MQPSATSPSMVSEVYRTWAGEAERSRALARLTRVAQRASRAMCEFRNEKSDTRGVSDVEKTVSIHIHNT